MAILNNSNAISTSGAYDINNSLRFRSSASAYLGRTPASAGNRKTWTWSAWVKRGTLGVRQSLFANISGTTDATFIIIGFTASDAIEVSLYNFNSRISSSLYRDPSAWYHIVFVADTNNATAQNRIRIYVNGNEITAFSTNATITQNTDLGINQNTAHFLATAASGYLPFDGYLAEVNFVDGQALTPSSFGETDTTTGSWKPKAYTGTYGTNGFYLPFKMNNSTSSYAGSFNGSSQYLSSSTALFNYTTANAATQTATIEAMVYLNSYQTASQTYYSPCIAGKGNVYMNLGVNGSGNLIFYHYDGTPRTITGSSVIPLNTWTYVAVVISGGTATIYVNGTSVGSGTWYGLQAAGQNSTSYFGRPGPDASALYLNGYISNLRVSSIARTISTPSAAYSNDANTNFLTLQSSTVVDNSTNAYAITNTGTVTTSVSYPFYTTSVSADYSGNANNWTSNNIQVAVSSTTYDAMTDSPTLTSATVANYAVLNPLNKGASLTIANGNLYADATTTTVATTYSTLRIDTATYWENYISATDGAGYPLIGAGTGTSTGGVTGAGSWSVGSDGYTYLNGTSANAGYTFTSTDIIQCAYDPVTGKFWLGKNNTWFGSGNPATGANPVATIATSNQIYALISHYGNSNSSANFGQRPFSYTPPTGFVALNTFNLPDSTIKKGNTVMDATTYTGTGATQVVTNSGSMKPDLVWLKSRSNARDHRLMDTVRGINLGLQSNLTSAEFTGTALSSINSNGFTLNTTDNQNVSAEPYIGWQWQAGQGSTSSNTSGSITSTVSVSTTAGFSVVTYTGSGTAATVGHGLGVAPKMVIVKNRVQGTYGNWNVWHTTLTGSQYLSLNTTDAAGTNNNRWNGTVPTSTVFSVGTDIFGNTNKVSDTYVAYCWAEIAGFSKFGSYTGNGSADGPFVYTGFRPKFVMLKRTDTAGFGWCIKDSSRSPSNEVIADLFAESSAAEYTTAGQLNTDFLSNGFKLRQTNANQNANGGTYIFMAFAENPFKNSLAR